MRRTDEPLVHAMTRLSCLFLSLLLLSGCAGFRGGWESIAYVGDTPPVLSGDRPNRTAPEFELPGLKFSVDIDNRLRTHDYQVMLFFVPVSIDPRNVYTKNVTAGRTRVFVTVVPLKPGFVFRPEQAILQFAGQRHAGVAGYEFGRRDAQGRWIEQGSDWQHWPLPAAYALSEPGRRYRLSIDFAVPVPSPESSDILLDLSGALKSDSQPPLPPIRFMPLRWDEGYT